ncbi:hypothetical protein MXB_111 [Myxobolus squamalis]|nr:hypothetical protein MXB_111 [Myxobolus squamalis]
MYKPNSTAFLSCVYNTLDFKIWKNLYCANIPKILQSQCFDSFSSLISERKQRDYIYKMRDLQLPSSSWESITNHHVCACGTNICYPIDLIRHCSNCGKIFCNICLTDCQGITYCSDCLKIHSITNSMLNVHL